jgi:hypothetical protein
VIVVASVPHSGTRFVFEHLLEDQPRAAVTDTEGYFVQHTEDRWLKTLTGLIQQWPCIVPLRHPRDVAASWCKHQHCNQEYYTPDRFLLLWRNLIEYIDPLKPLYLPLDAQNRDDYLEKIRSEIGLDLVTDWPVWASTPGEPQALDRYDGAVETVLDDPFCEKFGYR